MGVNSDGNPYGIPEGLIYSFPVRLQNKSWTIVPGLSISDFAREKMDITAKVSITLCPIYRSKRASDSLNFCDRKVVRLNPGLCEVHVDLFPLFLLCAYLLSFE